MIIASTLLRNHSETVTRINFNNNTYKFILKGVKKLGLLFSYIERYGTFPLWAWIQLIGIGVIVIIALIAFLIEKLEQKSQG